MALFHEFPVHEMTSGNELTLINVEDISYVLENGHGQAIIHFVGGGKMTVASSYADVKRAIDSYTNVLRR